MDLFSIARTPVVIEALPEPERERSVHYAREQLLDEIISINPSATAAFLDQFTDELLKKYLDHLHFTQAPRDGSRGWTRPADAPSMMMHRRVI